ncbi:hypothetical protein BJY01DRAFT_244708 [Aspergillus pseudoustus]|uniref:F-box domain-containing protein n=1 Tax=Aspergillus pseudoustus TaxID=1810923 RepID=A0ABR4KIJ0_9EURO
MANCCSFAIPLRRKRKRSQSETDEGRPAPSPEVRKDPFRNLCWDCGSIVLSYLDVRDLAQCERVDKGWRRFIHEWMGAVGLYQHFLDHVRSDLKTMQNAEDRAPVFKEHALNDAVHSKWTSEVALPACANTISRTAVHSRHEETLQHGSSGKR